MLLQVAVIPRDQPSLCFLWPEEPAEEIAVYQFVRHIFVAKDSPICAKYALKRNAIDNRTTFPKAARSVKNKFYMEDHLELSPLVEPVARKALAFVKISADTLSQSLSETSVECCQLSTERKDLRIVM